MKKFIINIILFTLVAIVCYPIYVFILGIIPGIWAPNLRYPLGHSYNKWADIKNYENVDIIIFGASNANRGFDTRIFEEYGLKAFNLGSSSQSPVQTQLLLNRYLIKLNPKVVILTVFPGFLENDGIESAIDIITNDENDIHSFRMSKTLNHLKIYNVLIYDTIREILKLNSNLEFPIISRVEGASFDTYIQGGFTQRTTDYHFNSDGLFFEERDLYVNDLMLKTFDSIITDLKNKNINCLILNLPNQNTRKNNYRNIDEYFEIMSKYEYYFELDAMLDLPDTCFYDLAHLNQQGAEALTLKTIEIINTLGVINK